MLRFFSYPCRWIKKKFVRNPSPSSLRPKPAEPDRRNNLITPTSLSRKQQEEVTLTEFQKFQQLLVTLDNSGSNQLFDPTINFQIKLDADSHLAFDQALKLQPDDHLAWFNRGFSLWKLDRYEEAVASFDQALKLQPNDPKAWYNRGVNLNNLDRDKEAVASYDRALKLQPDYPEAWYNRGLALWKLDRYEEAVASYDQALKLQPNDPKAWYNRGLALATLDRYEEAVASYDQVLKLQPNDPKAWRNRGPALATLDRYEEAVASYDQALKLQPDNHLAWYNRGNALMNSGRYEEAVASYDQALKLQSDNHLAWYNRGNALMNSGRDEEAVASYDQALKLQTDDYRIWYSRGLAAGNLSNYDSYSQQQFVKLFGLEISQVFQQLIAALENTSPDQYLNQFQKSLSISQSLLLKTFTNLDCPELLAQIQQPPSPELSQLIKQPLSPKLIDFIQQPLSESVRTRLEQDCLSHPARLNPQLNLRRYEGELASYQEELDKAICRDTHPLGWGKLHHALGQAHYRQGMITLHFYRQIGNNSSLKPTIPQKEQLTPSQYWNQTLNSYNQALLTLTEDDYPEERLEVLQDLIKVNLALRQTETAEQLRLQGLEVLFKLLNSKQSFALKKQLTIKFISFYQLGVDILVNKGEFDQALTRAELSKNICLINLLSTWQEKVISPSYQEIQQLLTPGTAIVYWHISPHALTTFVLRANATEPIVILQDDPTSDPEQPSQSLRSLQEFTTWLKEWNQQYQDYRDKTKDQEDEDRANHPWRKEMSLKLEQLKTILNIDKIKYHLSDITQLILIPHQDLHRLPLHVLFESSLTQITEEESLTINYFPSAQIALTLQQRQANQQQLSLLSVENPTNDLPFAEIESTIINEMFTNPTHIKTETATNPTVKAALQQPHHIFHFTGHGAYNQYQPEKSFLSLTGEDKLTAQEISQLDLKSYQLISLSACETGITGNQTIDTEYVGLTSGFLQAGAASVLHTLWTVEEISSSWLMIRFYQLFSKGNPPAAALQKAQQWLRTITYAELVPWIDNLATIISDSRSLVGEHLKTEARNIKENSDKMNSSSPPYAHLYYWAAFTLTGKKFYDPN